MLPGSKRDLGNDVIHAMYNNELAYYKNSGFATFATDASPNDSCTGCGIYDVTKGHRFLFKLNIRTSSTFGELFALRKALELAVEEGYYKVVIFTDSLAACKALGAADSDNCLVADFHNILQESLINLCHVVWAPGHRGIQINEEADYLAKQAAEVGAPVDADLTPGEALLAIKNTVMACWNEEFIELSQTKGRHFFQIYEDVYEKPWFNKGNFYPMEVKLINRLMIGHAYDKAYLHRIGSANSDKCETFMVPAHFVTWSLLDFG
ncbi:uncharacterized protein isoform X1 [Musca autumnalis]|uniref:uncharacterized protein isoform X1 n=1 Tax=Musca autumnalis TaxID=221902 RepID=UPI003CEC3303